MSNNESPPVYFLGHNKEVVQSYLTRKPQTYAPYILPYLKPSTSLLDIGCGPGSMTSGFASFCPEGRVVGIDIDKASIESARTMFGSTASFEVANVHNLPFADDSFDVVNCHQFLQHIDDVPAALKEMHRVMKAGGVMGARVVCAKQVVASIEHKGLEKFYKAYFEVTQVSEGDLNIMFHMPKLGRKAGFTKVKMQASSTCYVEKELEDYLLLVGGYLSPGEMVNSMMEKGFASEEDIEEMREFVRVSRESEDMFVMMPHLECICTK